MLGWQGALLAQLTGPLYFSSITIGQHFDRDCLRSSLIERLSFMQSVELGPGFRVDDGVVVQPSSVPFPDGLNANAGGDTNGDGNEQQKQRPWNEGTYFAR